MLRFRVSEEIMQRNSWQIFYWSWRWRFVLHLGMLGYQLRPIYRNPEPTLEQCVVILKQFWNRSWKCLQSLHLNRRNYFQTVFRSSAVVHRGCTDVFAEIDWEGSNCAGRCTAWIVGCESPTSPLELEKERDPLSAVSVCSSSLQFFSAVISWTRFGLTHVIWHMDRDVWFLRR